MNGQRRTDGGENSGTRSVEATAPPDSTDEGGSLDQLRQALWTAELRTQEVSVTITDVEEVSVDGDDMVRVSYEHTGSDGTVAFESFDDFRIPEVDSDRFEFVRLCRFLHAPLEQAHEDLVGLSLSAQWDDGDWTLQYTEDDSESGWIPIDSGNFYVLSFLLAVVPSSVVFFPLLWPLLFLQLWFNTRPVTAVGVTVGSLLTWTLVASVFVSTTGVLVLFAGSLLVWGLLVGAYLAV